MYAITAQLADSVQYMHAAREQAIIGFIYGKRG